MTTSARINLKLSRISVPEKINTFVVTAKGFARRVKSDGELLLFSKDKACDCEPFPPLYAFNKNFLFGML